MTSYSDANISGDVLVMADVFVEPVKAFEYLDQRPRWTTAFAVTCILAGLGTWAILRKISQSNGSALASTFGLIFTIVALFVSTIVYAAVLFGAARAMRSRMSFLASLSLAAHVGLIGTGLEMVVRAAIVSLGSGQSVSSQSQIATAIPSVAWVVPSTLTSVSKFAAAFDPFLLYETVLLAIGLRIMGHLPAVTSAIIAAALQVVSAIVLVVI